MKITTHPRELTKEVLEKWRKEFVKKVKRKTSRTDVDRLILAVDRREFVLPSWRARWTEFIFENGKGQASCKNRFFAHWELSDFEAEILENNPELENRKIVKSVLREENAEWDLDSSLKEISRGGEAIVLEEQIGGLIVAARVQCFDSALFTGDMEDYKFRWHLSSEFEIAVSTEGGDRELRGQTEGERAFVSQKFVIPYHPNVIKNYANCEIFQKGEVVGWITIMEKCDFDLRKVLKEKNELFTLNERKKVAIGVRRGWQYLEDVGIRHCDMKPENVLMKDGVAKWSDFGLIGEYTGRESYRQMGFSRRGSKYKNYDLLSAGSAGFADGYQLLQSGDSNFALLVLILCEWNTAWSLLFRPLEQGEEELIKNELESFNAGWMTNAKYPPNIEQIEKLTGIISLENASSDFSLDDSNLTKSCGMAEIKQQMTRVVNLDFKNLTRNVLDQKDTNLCVPISVSVLLRWALKNDLRVNDQRIEEHTLERILTLLTMVIYPRSLAGVNLNPKNEEKNFQHNNVEFLLRRIKNKSYLNKCGWSIICYGFHLNRSSFDYSLVLLHTTLNTSRPLTVTGAYLKQNGDLIFHQMILDRIENDEYVLQNTLHSTEIKATQNLSLLRIDRQKRYYAETGMFHSCYDQNQRDFIYQGANNEFMLLTTAGHPSMNAEEWYLLPQAYSVTLTPNY